MGLIFEVEAGDGGVWRGKFAHEFCVGMDVRPCIILIVDFEETRILVDSLACDEKMCRCLMIIL